MSSQPGSRHHGRLELTWTDKDKTLLSTGNGRYDYTFVDPSDYRVSEVRLMQEIGRVEAPTPDDRPEGLPEPTNGNLLITGDAMHVLDALAKIPAYAEQYLGRVKLVYIDPPFNTGQAFAHYEDNIEHSIWLTLLRDRIRQIKPLLADDGSIWVHLDDAEVHRCRMVLDEELGAENFVATVIWQKAYSPRNDAPAFSTDQDYILVYSKQSGWRGNRWERLASRDALYKSTDGDPRPWVSGDPAAPSAHRNQTWVYAIQSPFTGDLIYPAKGRCWGQNQDSMQRLVEEWGVPYRREMLDDDVRRALICGVPVSELRKEIPALMVDMDAEQAAAIARARYEKGAWPRLYFTKSGNGGLKLKRYLDEISSSRAPQTLWLHDFVGHSRTAKNEIKLLFSDETPFATPKPELLLKQIISIGTSPGEIVLDCFGGSGTTAAVAHKMGRRWVTSELLADTVARYTLPRLSKVVNGQDPGGVTTSTERVPATSDDKNGGGGLPEGMTPEEAQEFNRLLGKVAKAVGPELNDTAIKALKSASKTKAITTVNWNGGGSFTHLRVGESMFEQVEGVVLLADWATQGSLAEAMCAQLSVDYQPEGIFAARQGRTRYVIIDGMVGEGTVAAIVDRLAEDEAVEVWATQVDEAAVGLLKERRKGSRLELIPDKVLDNYRRKSSQKSPFGAGRSVPRPPSSAEGAEGASASVG
ncbi:MULTISPECIES: site-specific DNA-methyltransferase [Actinomadura]|uniref:Site-specific DNA-methyltransferase n=1 Tax=Actinomadura yumaensis TaxID=111807 RepID=A0ABW2CEP4_9ACTN|nr:site-specific DNA-methyltransferase [Actinomadura sp. J1-007]MWK34671.1 site-specific DNA-methyltransferase [Actinomadura sp. J1-007]